MKKQVLITLACIFFGVALFAGGYLFGSWSQGGGCRLSKVDQTCSEMLPTWMSVRQVDAGEYAGLKTNLNLQLDGEILKLHYMLQDAKKGKDVERATKLLKVIAAYRSKHPPVYAGYSSGKTNKAVDEILARYK